LTKSLDIGQEDLRAKLLEEIDEALQEIRLSEQAFQWALNDTVAVDYAIRRNEAAVKHYSFLLRQVKKLGIKLDNHHVMEKILQQM